MQLSKRTSKFKNKVQLISHYLDIQPLSEAKILKWQEHRKMTTDFSKRRSQTIFFASFTKKNPIQAIL